jgi:hypothetical protein
MPNRHTRNGSTTAERPGKGRQRHNRKAENAGGNEPRTGSARAEQHEKSRPECRGGVAPGSAARRANTPAESRGGRNAPSARAGKPSPKPKRAAAARNKQGQAGSANRAGRRPARAGSGLIETVRDHPVPAALVGAGVAWLVYEGVRRHYPEAIYDRTRDALESAGEGISSFGEKVSDAASSTGERFREQFDQSAAASRERTARFGRSVKSGAARLGEMVRDGASAAGHAVEQGYDYGREALGDLWQNHPLACGVGVLALGVATGMMLPSTDAERRAAGERARRILDRVGSAGRGLLDQGRQVADRVLHKGTSTLADEAEREGLTPERLARKVRRIARRVGEAVTDTAEGE